VKPKNSFFERILKGIGYRGVLRRVTNETLAYEIERAFKQAPPIVQQIQSMKGQLKVKC